LEVLTVSNSGNSIEQIGKKIEEAYTYRYHSAALFRQLMDEYKTEVEKIYQDRSLSQYGRDTKVEKLRREYEKKALRLSKEIHDGYAKALNDAENTAKSVLTADIPEVDEQTRKLFAKKAEELQAQVLFATNPDAATKALRELVQAANEPALAAMIKETFLGLSQNVLSLAGNPNEQLSLRKELAQLHEQLQNNTMTQEAREAQSLLNRAEGMKSATIFSNVVCQAAAEFSPEARHYLNNPDGYFQLFGGDETE
jgi:hypothetical protein